MWPTRHHRSRREIKVAFLPRSEEVHLRLANFRDTRDLRARVQHEALGHYATLTFSDPQKHALLDAISAGRRSLSPNKDWAKVDREYAHLTDSEKTDEVFCLAVERSQGLSSRSATDGFRIRSDGVRNRLRPLEQDDLQLIVDLVADGIRREARSQQILPRDNALRFRASYPERGVGHGVVCAAEPLPTLEKTELSAVQAFRNGKQAQILKLYPQLAGAYAAFDTIATKVEAYGLSPKQKLSILVQVRANIALSIERGECPGFAAQAKHQEIIEPDVD